MDHAVNDVMNRPGISKPDLGFGRVYVDVDGTRIDFQHDQIDRMAIRRQVIGIGRTDCT